MKLKYALGKGISIVFAFISILSCERNTPATEPETGHISFIFKHLIDGQPLTTSTMKYVNEAGNPYQVDELMYFISDVILYKNDGTSYKINGWTDIHYIDIGIASTLNWDVFDKIAKGKYDSISFTFGLSEALNTSFRFVNPPESNMMWPDILGGGYHFLMINGKWKTPQDVIENYAFHLGTGQLYHGSGINTDSIYAFVPNHFNVSLRDAVFEIKTGSTTHIEIKMNVESWFKTPIVYDHNTWGGSIMQNQEAMSIIRQNGIDVFTMGSTF
jgi:hypothetical protein